MNYFVSFGLPELKGFVRGEAKHHEVFSRGGENHLPCVGYYISDDQCLEQRATIGRHSIAKALFYPSAPTNGRPRGAEPVESDGDDELVGIRSGFFQDGATLYFSARHLGGPLSHSLLWFLDGILFILGWYWWILRERQLYRCRQQPASIGYRTGRFILGSKILRVV
jgi:hypothetical protein